MSTPRIQTALDVSVTPTPDQTNVVSFTLQTPILAKASGITEPGYATWKKCISISSYHETIRLYRLDLDSNEKISVGWVIIKTSANSDLRYRDLQNNILPHLKLEHIKNTDSDNYAHVGYGLHEIAFRRSIASGAQGRIYLEAIGNTFYFHYKNGYRLIARPESYIYFARDLIRSRDGKLTSRHQSNNMYLTKKTILANLKKFNIKHVLSGPEPAFEKDEEILEYIRIGECIMDLAEKTMQHRASMDAIVLEIVLYSDRGFSGLPRSLSDSIVQAMLKQLPLDKEENAKTFLSLFLGAIMLGEQSHHTDANNLTVDKIRELGETTLIDWQALEKSIPYLCKIGLRRLVETVRAPNARLAL